MKKQLLIFGLMIFIIVSGLTGCIREESKFEGTWRTKPIAGVSIGFNFKSDGSLTIEGIQTSIGTWKIEDEKLIITSDADESIQVSGTFTYKFSDDDKEVSLTQKGTTITLSKD